MEHPWFVSFKAACAVEKEVDHCIFQINTDHAWFPKKFLEDQMKDMPGSCWILMEGREIKKQVDLVAMGYNYNKKHFFASFSRRERVRQIWANHTRPNIMIHMTMYSIGMFQDLIFSMNIFIVRIKSI